MTGMTSIFTNGTIRTLDPANPVAEAVLVRDGVVVAVGTLADLKERAGSDVENVDLAGATMLPGFIESHNHFQMAGVGFVHVNLRGDVCDSIPEMQRRLAERASETPVDEWVVGRGYDQTLLAENRHPTRHDLDVAVPDHPAVIFHVSYHGLVANSKALERAGVNRNTADLPGGDIYRDEHGEPNGVFMESPAMSLISDHLPRNDVPALRDGLSLARDHYLPKGITAVHDARIGTYDEVRAYAGAIADGELPIRTYMMVAPELYDAELEGMAGDLGPSLGLPSGRLIAGPVKMFQDGAIQAYTASLTQPYFDQPDERGVKIHDPEFLASEIMRFHKMGHQIAIHGNGDAAIDDILNGYEAALEAHPRDDHRHRIEHCQTARPDQLERMARLGVTTSVFINHIWHFGDRHLSRFLGPERANRMEPLASMTKLGIRWGLHSDFPVTEVDPLMGIWLAVNRRTSGGQPIGEAEAVDVEQALRGFGPDAAYLGFQENRMGMISPGYYADFAIISGDPVADPRMIKDLTVQATIIGGEVVYEAGA
jgi:predicted amidohydrolase YtcJ